MYKKIISVMSVALVVFLCSTFPVFATITPERISAEYATGLDNDGEGFVYGYQLYGTLDTYDYEAGTSTSASSYYSSGSQDIVVTGYIRNNSYTPMFCSNVTVRISDNSNISHNINGFNYLYGDLKPQLTSTGYTFNLVPEDYIAFEQGFIVGPMKTVYFAFTVSTTYTVTGSPSTTNTSLYKVYLNVGWSGHSDVWEGHYGYTVNYGPLQETLHELLESSDGSLTIFDVVSEMHDAYLSNTQQSEGVTDQSSGVTSTIDSQHQSEANYFQNSQTAIQDTGIQNFQFDSTELGGLNGLKDDFTAVWTACGSLSRFWIASLTIGLALSIIRHRRMFEK